MRHVDFIRVVTFTAVVSEHTTASVLPASVGAGAFNTLTHFTRYTFVFISAFVLFHSYYRRDIFEARPFYRKRFGLVALPYLVWSLLYCALGDIGNWHGWPAAVGDAVVRIATGNAWYQLYFLLVSMQLYLLFPVLRWFVRRTEGRHGWLLTGALAIQVGYMSLVSFVPEPAGPLGMIWRHSYAALPMYTLFVALGALGAAHYDRVHSWVLEHQRLLWPLVGAGFALTMAIFLVRACWFGAAPADYSMVPVNAANSPLYPGELPWLLAAMVGLYLLGANWVRRPGAESGALAALVDAGSTRAFGVYLVHPAVIWLLGQIGFVSTLQSHDLPALVQSVTLVAVVLALSLALVELILHSRLSRMLAGRDRLRAWHSATFIDAAPRDVLPGTATLASQLPQPGRPAC